MVATDAPDAGRFVLHPLSEEFHEKWSLAIDDHSPWFYLTQSRTWNEPERAIKAVRVSWFRRGELCPSKTARHGGTGFPANLTVHEPAPKLPS